MNCILKKFVLRRLNALLEDYKGNVSKARANVATWTGRCKSLCRLLESLSAKLEDNELSPEELKDAVSEVETLVREW